MAKKVRICRVWIRHAVDESPDLSWPGEYGNQDKGCAIDREERGDYSRNEYRYWNPGRDAPHNPADWNHVDNRSVVVALEHLPTDQRDQAAKTINWPARFDRATAIAYLDQCYVEQNYQRCEAYNRGDWHMIGIIAKAEIVTLGDICQTIRSGGLWGVESDSGQAYLDEVAQEELAQLRAELGSLGLGKRAIDYAFKNVETVEA